MASKYSSVTTPRFAPETRRRYGMFYFRTCTENTGEPRPGWKSVRLFLRRVSPRVGPRCRGGQQFRENGKDPQGDGIRAVRKPSVRAFAEKGGAWGRSATDRAKTSMFPLTPGRAGMTALPGAARSASLRVRWTRFTSPSQSTTRPAANASSWARRVTIQAAAISERHRKRYPSP